MMKTIGNIIWLVFCGFASGLYYLIAGLLLCLTIIGIPLGKQLFKLASVSFWPFGKDIRSDYFSHPIANTLWVIFFGWEMTLGYLAAAVMMCLTIIGIPFALQALKLTQLSFAPFGADI